MANQVKINMDHETEWDCITHLWLERNQGMDKKNGSNHLIVGIGTAVRIQSFIPCQPVVSFEILG